MKTLCVTGHRPDGLPWKKNTEDILCLQFLCTLKEYLRLAISEGYTHFISGGALGVDTLFALTVIELKEQFSNITLEIAIPCKDQEKSWSETNKKIYRYIIAKADQVTCLSEKYFTFCMQKRNEYMVEKSDCVLCCFNGVKKGGTYSTIKLAQSKNKQLLHIDLSENAPNGGNQLIFFKDKIV